MKKKAQGGGVAGEGGRGMGGWGEGKGREEWGGRGKRK
jgi:hypothetical protein